MFQAAIAFLIVGILAYVLGANNIAGLSVEVGTALMVVFILIAVVSFLLNIFRGAKQP